MDRWGWLQRECSKRPPNRRLPGAASGRRNESAQREIALFSNKGNRKNRHWPVALHLNCFGVAAASAARIGAVVNLKVEDYYPSGKRFLLRFKEKGGKEKELPVHHKLEELLDEYVKAAGLGAEPGSPLFPAAIGKTGKLSRAACAYRCRGHAQATAQTSRPAGALFASLFRLRSLDNLTPAGVYFGRGPAQARLDTFVPDCRTVLKS